MSYEMIAESKGVMRQLADEERLTLGYMYPHAPLEILLGHGLTPQLFLPNPNVSSAFENSLQTFSCAFARNLFSQRALNQAPGVDAMLFPGNTCDSLQNVGDVWRHRYPDDVVFRLTYPVGVRSDISLKYFTQELISLSQAIENSLGLHFSEERYRQAVALVGKFRELAQYLYAARVVRPGIISYSELTSLVQHYLVTSSLEALDQLRMKKQEVEAELRSANLDDVVVKIADGLLNQRLDAVELPAKHSKPRIAVLGGMVEPQAIAGLFEDLPKVTDDFVVFDMLSFGYRTVFTPALGLKGDPYIETATKLLRAPLEPTQEGLRNRQAILRSVLSKFQIQGVIICEQSFCDPDEFEAPALQSAVKEEGVLSLRLPIDPELSDRSRLEVRVQTFLDTLKNG